MSRQYLVLFTAAAVGAALAFQCGGGDPPVSSSPACIPNQSVSCVGAGSCTGYQVCNAAGTAYSACDCSGLDAGVDADLDASGDGSDHAAPTDSGQPPCDLGKPFMPPTPLGGNINTADYELVGSLSPDELTIYFARGANANQSVDIYQATRATRSDAFGNVAPVGNVNGSLIDDAPAVTADGLTMYFESNDFDAASFFDIFVSQRTSTAMPFGTPSVVTGVSQPNVFHRWPYVTEDGSKLYLTMQGNNADLPLFEADCTGKGTCSKPVQVFVSGVADVPHPVVTGDGLTLYYYQGGDVWVANRATTSSLFANAAVVTELASNQGVDIPGWISPDSCSLYFTSQRSGSGGKYDIWVASHPPFGGD